MAGYNPDDSTGSVVSNVFSSTLVSVPFAGLDSNVPLLLDARRTRGDILAEMMSELVEDAIAISVFRMHRSIELSIAEDSLPDDIEKTSDVRAFDATIQELFANDLCFDDLLYDHSLIT